MKKAGSAIKQGKLRYSSMKRLFQIFELSNNEQRVILIVVFALVAIAFASYERRVHRHPVERTFSTESKASPSPVQNEDER